MYKSSVSRKPLNTLRGIETRQRCQSGQSLAGRRLENPSTPSGVLKLPERHEKALSVLPAPFVARKPLNTLRGIETFFS